MSDGKYVAKSEKSEGPPYGTGPQFTASRLQPLSSSPQPMIPSPQQRLPPAWVLVSLTVAGLILLQLYIQWLTTRSMAWTHAFSKRSEIHIALELLALIVATSTATVMRHYFSAQLAWPVAMLTGAVTTAPLNSLHGMLLGLLCWRDPCPQAPAGRSKMHSLDYVDRCPGQRLTDCIEPRSCRCFISFGSSSQINSIDGSSSLT